MSRKSQTLVVTIPLLSATIAGAFVLEWQLSTFLPDCEERQPFIGEMKRLADRTVTQEVLIDELCAILVQVNGFQGGYCRYDTPLMQFLNEHMIAFVALIAPESPSQFVFLSTSRWRTHYCRVLRLETLKRSNTVVPFKRK